MCADDAARAELVPLVTRLRRARRALIDAAQALGADSLDALVGQSSWTVRRSIQYCHANERWHFTRVYNFFEPEVKVYESSAASLEEEKPETPDRPLARECAEVWLVGRETEMWLDLLEKESLDSVRHASRAWPQGGWTIRDVFEKVTAAYDERTRTLQAVRRDN